MEHEHWTGEWWTMDRDVLDVMATTPVTTPAEIGHKLGIGEAAAASLLAMLATQGKVRIRLVERVTPPD
jgi:hypothetical protein